MKDLSIKKLYYSISEVSKITEVEQYVLRYWETEFEQLKPQKNRAGNRIFTNKDIQLILQIKTLLRDKKYTIEGARNIITSGEPIEVPSSIKHHSPLESEKNPPAPNDSKKDKPNLKKDLNELKDLLELLISKL